MITRTPHNFHSRLRGVTFVEMIVTIAIVSIVMIGSSIFFVRMWRLHGFTIETAIASMTAQRGVSEAVESIRRARTAQDGSLPIAVAEEHHFAFYEDVDYDGKVERVRYFVENGRFRRGVTKPVIASNGVVTYPAADDTVRDVANYIVNETANMPTFTYYGADDKAFAYDDLATSRLPANAPLGMIRMVKVLLYVNPDAVRAPNHVRIQSFAVIRNLAIYDNAQP